MEIPNEWRNWAKSASGWFEAHGASDKASYYFALLWGLAYAYGLQPRITSIFRDPKRQKELQERWDRGDRTGLRARPASNSKHSKTSWLGSPASEAIDMPCNDEKFCAKLARDIGLGAGADFSKPDPGHYYLVG